MQVGTLIYWNGPFTKGDPKNKWIGVVVGKDTRSWMDSWDYWIVSFPTTTQSVLQSEMEVLCK